MELIWTLLYGFLMLHTTTKTVLKTILKLCKKVSIKPCINIEENRKIS